MTGCRPLTDTETQRILATFKGRYALRDRALFLVALRTGLRISSLISLRIGDVWQDDRVRPRIRVRRATIKGKHAGFDMPLHPQAVHALQMHIESLPTQTVEDYVFTGRSGGNEPLHRGQAWRIFKAAFARAGLSGGRGELGCHSTRKTFACRMYENLGHDIVRTARALRHSSITTTIRYLSFDEDDVDRAIISS